jgi:hypothetical protein
MPLRRGTSVGEPRVGSIPVRGSSGFEAQLVDGARVKVVSRIFVSWNQVDGWLRRADALRRAS